MMNPIEQIWKEYHTGLHSFIQSRVRDESIADDILQKVFIRIHSRIDTLKNSRKMQSWIYQITRNTLIDHYRSHRTMEEIPESLEAPEMDLGDKTRQEIEGCFLPMIQSLPEHYRETLLLSEIEGLTQKEVAKKQGISISGAKARIQRGRSMLKDMLLECCRFEFDHLGNVTDYEEKGVCCDGC